MKIPRFYSLNGGGKRPPYNRLNRLIHGNQIPGIGRFKTKRNTLIYNVGRVLAPAVPFFCTNPVFIEDASVKLFAKTPSILSAPGAKVKPFPAKKANPSRAGGVELLFKGTQRSQATTTRRLGSLPVE